MRSFLWLIAVAAASVAVAQAGNSSDTYSGVVCDPKYTTKCDTLGKDFKGLYGGGGVYRLGYANNSAFVHSDSAYFTGAFQLLFRCNQTGFMSCEPWAQVTRDRLKDYPTQTIVPVPSMAAAEDGYLYIVHWNIAYKCRTAGSINQTSNCVQYLVSPALTYYNGISIANNRLFLAYTSLGQVMIAGKAQDKNINGILSCPIGDVIPPSCDMIPGSNTSFSQPINAMTAATEGHLWVVVSGSDAPGQLWRCPQSPTSSEPCRQWGMTNTRPYGFSSGLLDVGKDGVLFVWGNGLARSNAQAQITRCNMNTPSDCQAYKSWPSSNTVTDADVQGMVNLLTTAPGRAFVYAAVDSTVRDYAGVYGCNIQGPAECYRVASLFTNYYGISALASDDNTVLYTGSKAGIMGTSFASWVEVNACLDKRVVRVNGAQPIPSADPLGYPSTLTSSAYRASVSGNAVNCQMLPQTVTYAMAAARQIQSSVAFQKQNTDSIATMTKIDFKISTPVKADITAGFQQTVTLQVSRTETTTSTASDTVTTTETFADQIPPHQSCPVSGSISTDVQSWRQPYLMNVTYACGSNGTEIWDVSIDVTGVLTATSKASVHYGACTGIEMPPVTRTCASNPGCPGMVANQTKLFCCPDDNGKYEACCAAAAAHTADPPVNNGRCVEGEDYIDPMVPICPKDDWTPSTCCPGVTKPTTRYMNSIVRNPPPNGSETVTPYNNWAVCYRDPNSPQAYVADVTLAAGASCPRGFQPAPQRMGGPGKVGEPPVLTCLLFANYTLTSTTALRSNAAVVGLDVVSGQKPFSQLKCRAGYAKVSTPLSSLKVGKRVAASALCVKKGPARQALVLDSLQTVRSLEACGQVNGTVVSGGNLNYSPALLRGSQLAPPVFYCQFGKSMP